MTPINLAYLVITLAAPFMCFYIAMQSGYLKMPELNGHSRQLSNLPNNNNARKSLPRIMMWTRYFHEWYRTLDDARTGEVLIENCTAKCIVTNDPRLIEYSHAVVFHVRDLDMTNLPPKRFSWQKWIFYLMESPPHTYFTNFNLTRHMFNWTMTYRTDSDIYVPYGRIIPRDAVAATTKKDFKDIWKSKKKIAVWINSNCRTESRRERFVAELRRYMNVDVYGFCGDHQCPISRGDSCYVDFERSYFFALAFENSICVDYVTEKFFTALKHDIIPVVFGGANYSEIAPRHSYIDALSFESPKDLAGYLIKLSKNYTEYAAYFTWKDSHDIVRWHHGFCELCTKLHSRVERQRTSSYDDMGAWWIEGSNCRSWGRGQAS